MFFVASTLRRVLYRVGLFTTRRVSVPVIVVGNITVGGTGKTPFVIWLANLLSAQGVRVGIVLRGYGGSSATWPRQVTAQTSAAEVGDEAVVHATRTDAIVVAGPDRVAAAEVAISAGADIVLSDDGLQHYRLARDAEICVIDHRRGLGNGWLLPAGPLREPRARMKKTDLIVRTLRGAVVDIGASSDKELMAKAGLVHAVSLSTGEHRSLETFAAKVHAIAAIGHPEAFFDALRQKGLDIEAHAFPDHAELTPSDIDFADDLPVLMTEKDAVKCRAFAATRHWYVPLQIEVGAQDTDKVRTLIERVLRSRPRSR